jgi:sortase (surface protein transpeptidase)
MKRFTPPKQGSISIRPGKRVFWLSRPSKLSVGLVSVAVICVLVAVIAAGVPVVPEVWYRLQPVTVGKLAVSLGKPVMTTPMTARKQDTWLPPLDTALPAGHVMEIPTIGVKATIEEAPLQAHETALKRGPWRVPDFGSPENRTRPLILAAHRYGYLNWTNTFRRQHSFYNLPKLKPGDKVFVSWDQREYVYEIYGGDEGTQITDYSADLILYTCQYLESDQRVFRYARLLRG